MRTQTDDGRDSVYGVELRGPGIGTAQVDDWSSGDVWSHLQGGQSVTADVWRGRVVEVGTPFGNMETTNWPDLKALRPLLISSILLGVFLGGLVMLLGQRSRVFARRPWILAFIGIWLPMSGMAYGCLAVFRGHSAPVLVLPTLLAVAVAGLVVRWFIIFIVRLRYGKNVKVLGA